MQSTSVQRSWWPEQEANQSHCFLSEKAESSKYWLPTSILCIQLRTPAATSVVLIWKIPHRHVQRICLQGDPVKLSVTLTYHRDKLLELKLTLKSRQWLSTFCVLLAALEEEWRRRVLVWSSRTWSQYWFLERGPGDGLVLVCQAFSLVTLCLRVKEPWKWQGLMINPKATPERSIIISPWEVKMKVNNT